MTHTVGAVVAVAAVGALGARLLVGSGYARRAALWAALLWTSHLVLDYFTANVVPPSGARFLWPFSQRYWIASAPFFPEIITDPSSPAPFFASIFNVGTLGIWLREARLLVLVVIGVHALRALAGLPRWRGMREEA